jgi:hypothetical protein
MPRPNRPVRIPDNAKMTLKCIEDKGLFRVTYYCHCFGNKRTKVFNWHTTKALKGLDGDLERSKSVQFECAKMYIEFCVNQVKDYFICTVNEANHIEYTIDRFDPDEA